MTALVGLQMTAEEARSITDDVKADLVALWTKLYWLHKGNAHLSLGYSSWGAYYEAEFGESPKRGDQLVRAAKVVEALRDTNVSLPRSESVARELVPVLNAEGEEAVEEVWGEVVAEHGDKPTAVQVRTVVKERRALRGVKPKKPSAAGPFKDVTKDLKELRGSVRSIEKQVAELLDLVGAREVVAWTEQLDAAVDGLREIKAMILRRTPNGNSS